MTDITEKLNEAVSGTKIRNVDAIIKQMPSMKKRLDNIIEVVKEEDYGQAWNITFDLMKSLDDIQYFLYDMYENKNPDKIKRNKFFYTGPKRYLKR